MKWIRYELDDGEFRSGLINIESIVRIRIDWAPLLNGLKKEFQAIRIITTHDKFNFYYVEFDPNDDDQVDKACTSIQDIYSALCNVIEGQPSDLDIEYGTIDRM